jgi:hypothetical protein
MKLIFAALLLAFALAPVHAESRIVGVKVTWSPNPQSGVFEGGARIRVSIFSEVKGENQRSISVEDAAKILRRAEGWGSMVEVGIVTNAQLADYLPILQAISQNGWLNLAFVDGGNGYVPAAEIKRFMSVGAVTKS